MGSFDDRKQAFEKKHAHDAEMVFRATARRNKLLGLWAAERMGRDAEGAAAYAKEIVAAGLSREGDAAVATLRWRSGSPPTSRPPVPRPPTSPPAWRRCRPRPRCRSWPM
jgi:Uncharacterized conserved protein